MYRPTLEEMETVITFDRSSETASIYTADPAMVRRLDKLSKESLDIREVSRDKWSRTYECPKDCVKVRKPNGLSEEQRDKMAQRARERFHHAPQGSVNE